MKFNIRFDLSVFVIALILTCYGCGGGGGSGYSELIPSSASFTGDLSGDIDADGDGTALIAYTLSYPYPVDMDVELEFSVDGGATYSPCTEDTSNTIGGQENPTEGTQDLSAGPLGIEHQFAWDTDAVSDLPNENLNWVQLRLTTDEGDQAVSGYLTVTNDPTDSSAPELTQLWARAVPGPSNDTIKIFFDEAVDAEAAETRTNYRVENPAGTQMTIPAGSTIIYNPIVRRTTITLDGNGTANLQYGETCSVTVSNVTDLLGNAIEDGPGDSLSASVGGDGADLPDDQPTLLLAYFTGSGTPQSGEYLCLLFDEEMALGDSTFDNDDVEFFDAGDTLGAVPGDADTLGIELIDDFTVQITLGTGPDFTPGDSRINIPALNDVISDLAGNIPYMPGSPGVLDYELIITEDNSGPVVDLFTIAQIPDILNGKGDAEGELLEPTNRFDLYLEYHDVGGAGVDEERIEIVSNQEITYDGSTLNPNTDLVPYLKACGADDSEATFRVPAKMVFPLGDVTLRCRIWDVLENAASYRSFSFEVVAKNDTLRPFETHTNDSQVWNLIFTRDLYTITASGTTTITVTATLQSNSTADFDEDLVVLGLGYETPVNVTGTGQDSNEFMKSLVIEAVKEELTETIFDGVNIEFTEVDQGSIPGNWAQIGYNNFTHSQISIGGESDVGALGVAFVDRANQNQDNDVLYNGSAPYDPGTNLGIFTTRLTKYEINGSEWGSFRIAFDTFIPGRGTPVGEDAADQDILMDIAGTGPSVSGADAVRRDDILLAVTKLARFIAVVAAHEMGHSMGLSVDGAMPNGMYGGDATNFPGSDSNHISLSSFPDLFTLPAVNIMVPATNFWMTNATGTRFNYLNMAYLKEMVFYNP